MSIKSSELRIGNLVNYFSESADRWMDAREVSALDIECLDLGNADHADGIPVAEQWLLEFGFTNKNIDCLGKVTKRQSWLIPPDRMLRVMRQNKQWYFLIGDQTAHRGVYRCPITYIHHLQNIYFALTGRELTIKQ